MVIAYIRISTNKQDGDTQKLQILEYCQKHKIIVDDFMEVEQSSRKNQEQRRINELKNRLQKGDLLIICELSRLGRSMLEVMNLVLDLAEKGVHFVFLRQPELSNFQNSYSKLVLSFYAYIAETERDFISQRTKAGLEKAKAKGKTLGRPFGSLNSMYDKHIEDIKSYLSKEISLLSIWKMLGKLGTYNNFHHFCKARGLTQKDNIEKK